MPASHSYQHHHNLNIHIYVGRRPARASPGGFSRRVYARAYVHTHQIDVNYQSHGHPTRTHARTHVRQSHARRHADLSREWCAVAVPTQGGWMAMPAARCDARTSFAGVCVCVCRHGRRRLLPTPALKMLLRQKQYCRACCGLIEMERNQHKKCANEKSRSDQCDAHCYDVIIMIIVMLRLNVRFPCM